MTKLEIEIRQATLDDVAALSTVMSAAFDGDPLINFWVRQDTRRNEGFDVLMREMIFSHQIPIGTTFTDTALSGAAIWGEPPGKPVTTDEEWAESKPVLERMGGENFGHFEHTIRTLQTNHPDEPHWYLYGLGVHPDAQGTGVGSALIRHITDKCDSEGIPAYLETQRESNLPIYEHFGFKLMKRIRLECGGPEMRLMWREPK